MAIATTCCRVLIVDEISGTGETIAMVKRKVEALGARAVRSAVLYAHTGVHPCRTTSV